PPKLGRPPHVPGRGRSHSGAQGGHGARTATKESVMTTIEEPVAVDEEKLMSFVFAAVTEVGAALNGALVVMGDKLGWYRSLADDGPATPAELADRTGTDAHYTREWLNAQAAGAYVDYDPGTGRYTLPPEHAVALADESSP